LILDLAVWMLELMIPQSSSHSRDRDSILVLDTKSLRVTIANQIRVSFNSFEAILNLWMKSLGLSALRASA
jgi:hypothetical protein